MIVRAARASVLAAALLAALPSTGSAHSGPPYPVISKQAAGAYRVSLWTDPDATDDGSPGGQFWVVLESGGDAPVPPATRARVAIRPLDRDAPFAETAAEPVDGDVTRQFAGLLLDHEGPFGVRVAVDGPWGSATLEAQVQATYDERPPLPLLLVYMLPFLFVGFLWTTRLVRRRAHRSQ